MLPAIPVEKAYYDVMGEDALKEWITATYGPLDLYNMDYLISKILGEATTEQLQFIDDAIHHRL